ncbi:methyltransferase domain-containing protein [bacterium]|nr:MAG: methyltransferase domain-containing protein [bacterium]
MKRAMAHAIQIIMKKFAFAFVGMVAVASLCWAAPKSDGTKRQTAQPWTGTVEIFETPGRATKLQLPNVYRDLRIGPGTRVADIGAGGGWLSVRLGFQVGPTGRVYAQDILPKYTDYIERRAKATGLNNVQTVLGTMTDPKLPAKTLDVAVILNAYHEFDEPLSMLTKIRAAMKPGGRLGILERDTDGLRLEARNAYAQTGKILRRVNESNDKDPRTDDHQLALDIVKMEGIKAGWKFVSSRELGDDNYLAVFVAP